MVDKVIRGDKVAVLISPGFGAGWTTWNQDHKDVEQMLYDPDIVNALLEFMAKEDTDWRVKDGSRRCLVMKIKEIANAKYNQDPDDYYFENGLRDVEVVWVQMGRKFIINEYDGAESIQFCDEIKWITP